MEKENSKLVVSEKVHSSLNRLRHLCRAPINEPVSKKEVRLGEMVAEFMELFGLPETRSRKGLMDIFRLIDSKEDRAVLTAARDYLRMELGRMQTQMEQYLQTSETFDPVLRKEMKVLLESSIMLSRPSAIRPLNHREMKESLRGTCTIPRVDLMGHGFKRIGDSIGDMLFHVCHQIGAIPREHV